MFTVYSMEVAPGVPCPYCKNAKELLTREGKKFVEKNAGVDFTREELVELLGPVRTLPQIVVHLDAGDYLIGGYNDLIKYFSGELADLRAVNCEPAPLLS